MMRHLLTCSHTLRINFHYETYIGISPYRTPAVVELQSIALMSNVTSACEKIQTSFTFRAISEKKHIII